MLINRLESGISDISLEIGNYRFDLVFDVKIAFKLLN